MATVQTELKSTILASGFMFPESLRWHKGKLWFSDIYGQTVYNVDTKGHATVVAKVPERPTGLGFLPDGTMLIAARGDKKGYRLGPGGLHVRADLPQNLGDAPGRHGGRHKGPRLCQSAPVAGADRRASAGVPGHA